MINGMTSFEWRGDHKPQEQAEKLLERIKYLNEAIVQVLGMGQLSYEQTQILKRALAT